MLKNKKIILVTFFLISVLFATPVFAQWMPDTLGVFGLPSGTIYSIVANVLAWIMAIFFLLCLAAFAISGILYLTAGGDDNQIEKAKTAMKYSIIGVIVGLSGYIIVQAVSIMLGGTTAFF